MMKQTLLILFLALLGFNCQPKETKFQVIETLDESFRISRINGNTGINYLSFNQTKFDDKETILMVDELLLSKNDTRKCSLVPTNYNPAISQVINLDNISYSIQTEALYLINILFFDDPFSYSPIPILMSRNDKQQLPETEIEEVYKLYKKWFGEVKKQGLSESRKNQFDPLNGSEYKWYYGK